MMIYILWSNMFKVQDYLHIVVCTLMSTEQRKQLMSHRYLQERLLLGLSYLMKQVVLWTQKDQDLFKQMKITLEIWIRQFSTNIQVIKMFIRPFWTFQGHFLRCLLHDIKLYVYIPHLIHGRWSRSSHAVCRRLTVKLNDDPTLEEYIWTDFMFQGVLSFSIIVCTGDTKISKSWLSMTTRVLV